MSPWTRYDHSTFGTIFVLASPETPSTEKPLSDLGKLESTGLLTASGSRWVYRGTKLNEKYELLRVAAPGSATCARGAPYRPRPHEYIRRSSDSTRPLSFPPDTLK